MDNVLDLPGLTSQTVKKYIASSANSILVYGEDPNAKIYYVNVVPDDYTKPHIMIMAQVVGDRVVVLTDTTDRPLHEELEEAGIPRSKIIVAYRGEKVPA